MLRTAHRDIERDGRRRRRIKRESFVEVMEDRVLLSASLLDPSFGGGDGVVTTDFGGRADSVVDMAVLPDGKILAAGTAARVSSGGVVTSDFALARYNPDGSLDTTFGTRGKVTTDFHNLSDAAAALAVLPGGKLLVVGSAARGSGEDVHTNFALARYNADGSRDRTFDGDGKAVLDLGGDDAAADVAVLPDGDICVIGTTSSADGGSRFAAARFNPDGTRDRAFGSSGKGVVMTRFADDSTDRADAVSLAPGGNLVVGGSSNGDLAVARYDSNGVLDPSFGGDGLVTLDLGNDDAVHDVAVLPDGDILVSGSSGYDGGSYTNLAVVRFNGDGTTDGGFGGGDGAAVGPQSQGTAGTSLAFLPGGRFLAAAGAGVARFNADGSPDATFDGQGGYVEAASMAGVAAAAVQNGKVVLGGRTSFGDDSDLAVARLKNLDVSGDGDDQIAEAVAAAVGGSKTGRIESATDVDMFAFRVSAGQQVGFDVDRRSGSSLDSMLRLFDGDGNELASSDDAPALGEPAATTESYFRRLFVTGGMYYVGVSGSPNADYNPVNGVGDAEGSGGAYRLTLTDIPLPADGDDQIAEAAGLAVGRSKSGSVGFETDVDMYRVTVTGGQQVGIDLDRAAGSAINSLLRLFDASGTELAANDDGAAPGEQSGPESYVRYSFGAAGTYYVGVSGIGNGTYNAVSGGGDDVGSTGGYVLSVVNIPLDEDDQVAEATQLALGGSWEGRINPTTDVDMYRFDTAAGQAIAVDVDLAAGSALNSRLRLFRPTADGVEQVATSFGAAAAPDETSANGEAYVEFLPDAAGPYYVGVSEAGNDGYDAVTGEGDGGWGSKGGYGLRLSTLAVDPDDQVAEATPLVFGAATAGAIRSATDVTMYSFTVGEGEEVTFNVDRHAGSTFNSYLRVFNADGAELASNDNGSAAGEPPGDDSYLDLYFSGAGTYYVAVSGFGNGSYDPTTGLYDRIGSTGSYVLTPAKVPVPADPDPDDQIAEAVAAALGSTVKGAIKSSTDVNMYAVTVEEGHAIEFDVDGAGLSDGYLRVFDADGAELDSNDDQDTGSDSYDPYLVHRFESGGTYYVGISGFDNSGYDASTGRSDRAGDTGGYRLTITDLGAVPSAAADPDDQTSEAVALTANQTRSDQIDPASDVDMYHFDAVAGQEVIFSVDQRGIDAWLRLFDAEGQEIASSDGDLRLTFEEAGPYYLGVSGYENEYYDPASGAGDYDYGWSGPYSVTARVVPPDADDQLSEATPLGTGRSVDGEIDGGLDVDMYSFTARAGQRVAFDVDLPTDSGLDSYLRLFDSNGNELLTADDSPAPGESEGSESYLEYVFASGGTYYVAVSGSGNGGYDPSTGHGDSPGNTGRYTLRVVTL